MRKSDIPMFDLHTDADADKASGMIARHQAVTRDRQNAANYATTAVVAYRDRRADQDETVDAMSGKDLAEILGTTGGVITKLRTVAGVLGAIATGVDTEQTRRVVRYADLAGFTGLVTVATGLLGADGDDRARSIVGLVDAFGAPSALYAIATGSKVHPSDDQDDQDDQGDQDDQDDQDATPWQDRLTAMLGQCRLEGATDDDIAGVVRTFLAG